MEETETKKDEVTPTEPVKQEEKPVETMIPKTRFDEVNEKYKEMEAKVAQFEQAQQAAAQAEKEKQGEWEQLYRSKEQEVEQLSTYKQRTESLEGVIGSMVEAKKAAIPEDFHDLIPSNLSAEQTLDWLNKAESKGMFKVEDKSEQSIGSPSSPKRDTKVDTSKLSIIQQLTMGYDTK